MADDLIQVTPEMEMVGAEVIEAYTGCTLSRALLISGAVYYAMGTKRGDKVALGLVVEENRG